MKKTFTMIFFSPKCASVSLFIQNIASAENILLPLRVFEFKSLLKTVHPLPPFFQLPLYPNGVRDHPTISLVIVLGSLPLRREIGFIRSEIFLVTNTSYEKHFPSVRHNEFCHRGVLLLDRCSPPPPPPPPVELDSTSCRLKNGQLYLSSETYVKLGLKRFKEDRSIDILQAAVGLK